MAPKYKEPIRMCVICRRRTPQSVLLRLQCKNRSLSVYGGNGRSFYLCDNCIETKNTARSLARQCKTNATQTLLQQLKEIIIDVR
ncbi:MAG: hypothetical protein DRG24_03485 [Epsilonproteobacteria bacterium]|nr:MAG: hypothetical protein DRG24_03485 [Campylobacterota bacterium]